MEIIFNCPHCEQELSVDSAGAGSEIPCPTCGADIVIPEKPARPAPAVPAGGGGGAAAGEDAPRLAPSAIASSAAAKVEMHLKVPVHSTPGESLIKKSAVPLDAIAKGADKQIRIKTMRHDKCIESGHDKFDEMVSKILGQIGEPNIVGIHPINYEHFDVQTQKVMNDYGLVIIYRG
jgi:DNA-directed RNA polymerase subunit RPC12/RpoP